MIEIKRMVKGQAAQRGYALVLSLVIMGFGTLVVGSALTYVSTQVNVRAIARDNLNAYYAADAGIQLVITKLVKPDYAYPLEQRYDENDDGTMDYGEPPDTEYFEYYKPSDLFPELWDFFPDEPEKADWVNGYEVRMTVEYAEWNGGPALKIPEYATYRITAYVFDPVGGATQFDEAKDRVTAIIRQTPYPLNPALTYQTEILSWQRQ